MAKESGGKEIKTSELGYLLEACKLDMDVDEMENAMNKLDRKWSGTSVCAYV